MTCSAAASRRARGRVRGLARRGSGLPSGLGVRASRASEEPRGGCGDRALRAGSAAAWRRVRRPPEGQPRAPPLLWPCSSGRRGGRRLRGERAGAEWRPGGAGVRARACGGRAAGPRERSGTSPRVFSFPSRVSSSWPATCAGRGAQERWNVPGPPLQPGPGVRGERSERSAVRARPRPRRRRGSARFGGGRSERLGARAGGLLVPAGRGEAAAALRAPRPRGGFAPTWWMWMWMWMAGPRPPPGWPSDAFWISCFLPPRHPSARPAGVSRAIAQVPRYYFETGGFFFLFFFFKRKNILLNSDCDPELDLAVASSPTPPSAVVLLLYFHSPHRPPLEWDQRDKDAAPLFVRPPEPVRKPHWT